MALSRRWRRVRIAAVVVAVLVAGLWVNNTSVFTTPDREPLLLAHRGIGQTFDLAGVEADTCTATRIHKPDHPYLENTIESMRAAYDAGADIVEFDVHLTKDDKFAVFHDWTLECRTDGHGPIRDHTLAELQKLDIGYGYTADGGKTYPFRGKGVGLMPSLDQVLDEFAGKQLLIHVKSDDRVEGKRLADRLRTLSAKRLKTITVYGGDNPIAALAEELPQLRVMSKATLMNCLGWYEAVGWTGYVPDSCRSTQLHVPETYAPWLWGWPHRFIDRMAAHDTRVVIVAGDGGWSEGFDRRADLDRLPDQYAGTIWTNRVDRIAPSLTD